MLWGTLRRRTGQEMRTPGITSSPIPHRRHKYIISFHVKIWVCMGAVGVAGDRKQSLKVQNEPPNLISKAMVKAGMGCGSQVGSTEEPLKLRPKEVMMSMLLPLYRPQRKLR